MNKNIIIGIFLILGSTFGLLGMEGQQEQQGKKRPFPLEKEVDSQQPNSQKKAKPSLEHYSFCSIHAVKVQHSSGLTNHIRADHYNKEKDRFECQLCPENFPKPYDVFLHWLKKHKLFMYNPKNAKLLPNENTKKIIINYNFCPCGRKETTIRGFYYRHLRSHHRDEKTNLIHCPFECGATFIKPGKIVRVHLEEIHSFFIKERQIYNPSKPSDDVPEQSSQSLQQETATDYSSVFDIYDDETLLKADDEFLKDYYLEVKTNE